jgi:hypothetical protein
MVLPSINRELLHSDESAKRDADPKFRKHRFECPPAGGMKAAAQGAG